MSPELTQSAQKTLEFQELGQVLRAADQARRTAVTIFAPALIALLGFMYSQNIPSDTLAYLNIMGLMLTFMFYFLFIRYTRTIKYAKERLLVLQGTIGVNVYTSSAYVGFGEQKLHMLVYTLAGTIFFINSIYFFQDASVRHHLLFQSCGPYADVSPYNVEDSCPCGSYPSPTETQNACPIPSSTGG